LLARLDKIIAPLSWLAAAAVVVMLLAGPAVVAGDKDNPPQSEAAGAAPYASGGSGGKPDGKAVFTDKCGSCHTLKAAGTSGQVGPRLDGISLDAAAIEETVRKGRGGMPPFEDLLSPAELRAVVAYVAASR
jgi:mono/diheme cytochrome c family protein